MTASALLLSRIRDRRRDRAERMLAAASSALVAAEAAVKDAKDALDRQNADLALVRAGLASAPGEAMQRLVLVQKAAKLIADQQIATNAAEVDVADKRRKAAEARQTFLRARLRRDRSREDSARSRRADDRRAEMRAEDDRMMPGQTGRW